MLKEPNFDEFDRKLDELLRLPRFSPSEKFSERVMAQVGHSVAQVGYGVAPVASSPLGWSVPASIARWVPSSRPARYAAAALATATSIATTGIAVILASQFGLATFLGTIAVDRLKVAATLWGAELINGALGQTALGLISSSGSAESALVLGGLVAGGITAFAGLKKAAALHPRTI